MPIEVGIWRLGEKVEKVDFSAIESENKLEDTLVIDLSILAPQLMLIGRQVTTAQGKVIDILAMDSEGDLIVVELKRNRTPREVVAQVLDYGSWVQDLSIDEIKAIYAEKNGGKEIEKGFSEAFGVSLPDELNQNHRLIVVASELDHSTERIIAYLSENYEVPINAVFFRHFADNGHEYLTRTWLIDPQQPETRRPTGGKKPKSEPWNGRDFYVTLGDGAWRSWQDCIQYGFVSAGGGRQYTQQFNMLFPGARVFAYVPQSGYVGVGVVKETPVPIMDFTVRVDGQQRPILDGPLSAPDMGHHPNDPENCEHLVRVQWEKTVPKEDGYREKGLFATPHICCRLRNRFTLDKLVRHFGLDE
ncbi:MAG TPA: DUF91 domain-containing protein [Planctomycetaceae bacterium]|nr:DUF91 domain-containing protein [Planctomycetaceae bacterium]